MKILYPLLLCFLVAAAYMPTLTGEFILDDRPYVEENPYIKQFHSLRSYFSQEDGIVDYFRNVHSGYYRPLINLSYTLDYKIWGMKASGFRATNLIFHLLSCLLLYQLLQRFSAGRLVPFAVTLLFGLHPVNTEAVAWVTSRNNILVTLFCLLSFRFYVEAGEAGGFITFTAHLYERRGSDKPGVALIEGHNVVLERTSLREQGPIINSWDLAGEGTTWGEERLTSHAEDASSVETYGLREASQIYSDVSVQATLDSNADRHPAPALLSCTLNLTAPGPAESSMPMTARNVLNMPRGIR